MLNERRRIWIVASGLEDSAKTPPGYDRITIFRAGSASHRYQASKIATPSVLSLPTAEILPKTLRAFQRKMPNVHVRSHDWTNKDILDWIRDGRLQLGLIVLPAKASALHDVRHEELFQKRLCVAVAPQHPFARRCAIRMAEVAAEPLIVLTREDYPNYYDFLSTIFAKVKQKPRLVEEHGSFSGIISAVEAGTGVTLGVDVLARSFGNRVKLLHITPEPKPTGVAIVALKGRLSPAAEKSWECAKEAASAKQ